MTYETIARISQVSTLLFFMAFFVAVLVYVFWPGNKLKFDSAARQPLRMDDDDQCSGDLHGGR